MWSRCTWSSFLSSIFRVYLVLCLGVVNNRYSFALFFVPAKALRALEATRQAARKSDDDAKAKNLIFLQTKRRNSQP